MLKSHCDPAAAKWAAWRQQMTAERHSSPTFFIAQPGGNIPHHPCSDLSFCPGPMCMPFSAQGPSARYCRN